MSKPQFTFKNYLKELKKSWLLLAIFFVIGAGGGAYYAFTKPTNYEASAKFSVYNSIVNTGSITSPYAQIGSLLESGELIKGELSEYSVVEKPFGVFEVVATASSSDEAIKTANMVMDNADEAIAAAFDDYEDYRITILARATESTQTMTTKKRIISTAVAAFAGLALALVVVFIKFDYKAEK